jgi:hypothetical protein
VSDLLQERYGTGHPRRRVAIIVATTILGVSFISWLAWAAWFQSDPAIRADLTSYDVVSTHEVKVKIEARFRNDHVQGSCLVRATASDHTIVGELNLGVAELKAFDGKWISIRTERRATTVALIRCMERGS